MNHRALGALHARLASGRPACGLWITLEAPSITEMAVTLGLDWVVLDAEHGHLDWGDLVAHLRCCVRSPTVALIRLAEVSEGLIKRALDIGADGVVLPRIESAEQLEAALRLARYPPVGIRGMGAERATAWGEAVRHHVSMADQLLVVPIIESVRGGENLEAIARVPGVPIVWLGPADYSASAGEAGSWESPRIAAELTRIRDTLLHAGKHVGILTRDREDLARRRDQGFRLLGLGMDTGLLLESLHTRLAALGLDQAASVDLSFPPHPI